MEQSIEQEITTRVQQLSEEHKQQVLEFVQRIESPVQKKTYSARELLRLPSEERNRLIIDALERSADEDFEIFEAYSEDDFDDLA
jgi:hypothetical protein